MASHRKPRTRSPLARTAPALGITTAALTSVALLSQSANAAPSSAPARPAEPSLEEVQKKVDDLYHQAGVATQKYNSAKERTDKQRKHVDKLLDDVAERTDDLNEARRQLGSFAAAQYRTGAVSETAALMLADDPKGFFDQNHLAGRLTSRQKKAVDEYQAQQVAATKQRAKAAKNLKTLSDSRDELKSSKRTVQTKLGEARTLLSKLTTEEKARLAAIEKRKEEAARRKAAELARKQAEEERERKAEEAERRERERNRDRDRGRDEDQGSGGGSGTGSGSDTGSGSGSGSGNTDSGYAAKAEKVIAFAEKQIGKPYVWGATGPGSYDCSGLTQAAWKTAGISLPRTTWDQVKVGTKVSTSSAKRGDLVFFYDDISHVGIYIGNGKMIHAPKPGANVRVESIYYMPIHSVVRPA
ncbi:C40 family peptidase [Streptomyces spectabilis]|uniref:Cell wall-associated NlpC family hydrolase n=1 Tax=Streptomyces spectabilis TaxID=68270 RepID=A0A5P2XB76_STRST|nr:C40 family peptidase [Streptomyces spectabilis]MBB5108795.1 cell wall-associated NlpC family hydrolase [Streptomyces spectabilis]MCI3904595.1 NlpC/P60 family protein [Streptomyces spectabilis]QEV61678.1 glycoside hydrolase [Streptomyces spectabilis]GGV28228.1 glycoside hydrolase [Streptomyces spectabilis]